ncbi:MAG: hypothetical protein GDA52_09070 [Rhodobacteraceae bacterium]|nr:hypothetical protein [Paracoccaceae bacterium]
MFIFVQGGTSGDDRLTGGGNNDLLEGDEGADTLDGGEGADTLDGGEGNDSLTGDSGADHFRFVESGSGADTIKDFNVDEDKIVLDEDAFADAAAVIAAVTVVDANTLRLALPGDGDSVTFTGRHGYDDAAARTVLTAEQSSHDFIMLVDPDAIIV